MLEILYTTSKFLPGMQLIIVTLKRKEEIQIKVSLIFEIVYQCVFLKYFLQLMLRIVILYPTSLSSNALKNNVACTDGEEVLQAVTLMFPTESVLDS